MDAAEKQVLYTLFSEIEAWQQEGRKRGGTPPVFTDDPVCGAAPTENTVPESSGNRHTHTESAAPESPRQHADAFTASGGQAAPPLSDAPKTAGTPGDLAALYAEVRECKKCNLCVYRTNAVPGMGQTTPAVMVVGEGPGADEDEQGLPFVGKAGQLLDKMLGAIGLSRSVNCYIANIVKCRPPKNRTPYPDETAACIGYLTRQIELLKPKAILAMGRTAANNLLETEIGITKMHGNIYGYSKNTSIPVLVTYHPSALLRDESLKRPAWNDLKTFRAMMDRDFPGLIAPAEM